MLQEQITAALKTAMKAKDRLALEALRAVKSELLLLQTSGQNKEISEQEILKVLQKLVKQRKDSAAIYSEKGRSDLAEPELDQAKIISQFLPTAMSDQEIDELINHVLQDTGASSMADMGRVMGIASKAAAGRAESTVLAQKIKAKLTQQ